MKKKTIILLSILSLGFSVLSQGIEMQVVKTGTSPLVNTDDLTDYSSGHSPFIYNVTSSNIYNFEIDVKNETGVNKTWKLIRFNESDVPSTWSTTVCGGSACSMNSPLNPYCFTPPVSNPFNVPNGTTGFISFHVTVNSLGTGTYKVYLGTDCTSFDDSIEFQINSTVGIDELSSKTNFSVFPNPSNDIVSVKMENNKKGNLKIVDIIGNVIYEEVIVNSTTLNVSEFKNGIYFVAIENDDQISSNKKLIVKH